MNQRESLKLIKVLTFIFSVLVVIDSIAHVVKEIIDLDNEILRHSIINSTIYLIILNVFRMFVAMMAAIICYKEHRMLNKSVAILLTIFCSIVMIVITYLMPLLINFRRTILSLIVQLILTFVLLAMAFNLLMFRFADKNVRISVNGDHFYENRQSKQINVLIRGLRFFDKNSVALSTLITVVLAISVGALLRENGGQWSQRSIKYVGIIGEMFLRALKCLILPLIFSSLVYAMASLDTKLSGRIGLRIICYYMATTVLATILGILLVVIIRPGYKSGESKRAAESGAAQITTEDSFLDLIRNVFPDNLIEACFQTYQTNLVKPALNESPTNETNIYDWDIKSGHTSGTNILGIVVFAVIFGVIAGQLGDSEGKIIVDFFRAFNAIMMRITGIVIQTTPIAVLFLVLPQVLQVNSLTDLLGSVGWYTMTVLTGLFIHGLIVLPLIYLVFTRKNPFPYLVQMSAALMTAFGTASSSATMPVTFQCLEERNHIDKRIVRFCIPLGATINMDGTALYEAVAALFIAQYRDIELGFIKVVLISITATAASIGAAGIPQAGLVTMVIVLNAVGLPVEDSALIFVVDWLIDRFRTTVNVLGDALGSGIVYHLSRKELETTRLSV